MTLIEDSIFRTQIYQLVKYAVLHLTGDKSIAESFCSNVAKYVYDNAESFVDHYGEISKDTLAAWLSEFPIETLSN